MQSTLVIIRISEATRPRYLKDYISLGCQWRRKQSQLKIQNTKTKIQLEDKMAAQTFFYLV